jgi:hypothetical protein
VINAPELWRGGFEAKANFSSAALLLAQEDDPAILLFASSHISQNDPVAQYDGLRQSSKTTVSTKHNSTRGICEWSIVGRLALHDHRQLRKDAL